MAKLKSDAIQLTDIDEYLDTFDDFQFEMQILKLCRSKGVNASHGGLYRDPVTNRDRQYDIRAEIMKDRCIIKLAVECKNLRPNYPLLVSRVPRQMQESFHELIRSTRVHPQDWTPNFRLKNTDFCFPEGLMVGKSTAQIGRALIGDLVGADTDTYDKWSQAIASSADLVSQSRFDSGRFPGANERGTEIIVYVQPILVVADGTLWVADYDIEGNKSNGPVQIEECSLYLGKQIVPDVISVKYEISHLLMFTELGFRNFLDVLTNKPDYWKGIFREFNIESWL